MKSLVQSRVFLGNFLNILALSAVERWLNNSASIDLPAARRSLFSLIITNKLLLKSAFVHFASSKKMRNQQEIYKILSRKHGLKLTSDAAVYLNELFKDLTDFKVLLQNLDFIAREYVLLGKLFLTEGLKGSQSRRMRFIQLFRQSFNLEKKALKTRPFVISKK